MLATIQDWLQNSEYQAGQGLVEYSFILLLVAVVVVVVITTLGESIQIRYHYAYAQMRCAHQVNEKVSIFEAQGGSGATAGELAFMRVNSICQVVETNIYDTTYRTLFKDNSLGNSPE